METDPVQDILNTWKNFLTDVIRSREYREYHCLENFKMEEIEDRNLQRYKAVLIKKLIDQGADPGLLDQ